MVLGLSPATLAEVRANLEGHPACLGPAVQNLLLAYRVEGKSPKTLDRVKRTMGDFLSFTRANGLSQDIPRLQPNHIRLFLAHLQEKGLAPSSVNWSYRCL